MVRSVLVGEAYSFADFFDAAYAIKTYLQVIINQNISLMILTDLESVFKVIFKSTVTTEKRLMIDVEATREAYDRN